MPLPLVRLRATDSSVVDLTDLPFGRSVIFVYPRTSHPVRSRPRGWETIPGALGCTSELCGVRDEIEGLRKAGAAAVFGLSTQDWRYQGEVARRLGLPFPLLADPTRSVGRALRLPIFTVGSAVFYRRLTLVVQDGVIEHVFCPILRPDAHAAEVIDWLRCRRRLRLTS